jgi:5-methylcytosine-specific restriction endonuclease McrA
MDIIEMFPCSCLEELEDKEAEWIENNECVNEHVPGALRRAGGKKAYDKKRYEDNKEAICEKNKQRYADNKEAINAKRNIKHNCDVCGGKYTTAHKARHFNSKKHQKAIADAVAVHAPPTQPQTINNTYNNTINSEVCNITQ